MDEAHWDCYDRPHIAQWMKAAGIARGTGRSAFKVKTIPV